MLKSTKRLVVVLGLILVLSSTAFAEPVTVSEKTFELKKVVKEFNKVIQLIYNNLEEVFAGSDSDLVEPEKHKDIVTGPDLIPIIMYHHITENPDSWDSVCIPPDKFKEDLLALKKAGYTTVLPVDLVDFKEGRRSLPGKPVMITFDDGYLSNYEFAYPILKELNMKATISVIGDYRGRKPGYVEHFSWEQGKEMYESGLISIQSHTHNLHYSANKEKGTGTGVGRNKNESVTQHKLRLKKDLQKSINDIEENIGEEVLLLAYPFGAKEDYTDDLLKELGLKISLTVKEDVASLKSDLFSLPRINAPYERTSEDLLKMINNMKLKKMK